MCCGVRLFYDTQKTLRGACCLDYNCFRVHPIQFRERFVSVLGFSG